MILDTNPDMNGEIIKIEYEKQGFTRKQVIEAENNPDNYHLEDPSSNRSHKYEKK